MKPVLAIILYIDLALLCSCIDNMTIEDKETIGPIGIEKIEEIHSMPPAVVDYEAIRQMEKK